MPHFSAFESYLYRERETLFFPRISYARARGKGGMHGSPSKATPALAGRGEGGEGRRRNADARFSERPAINKAYAAV